MTVQASEKLCPRRGYQKCYEADFMALILPKMDTRDMLDHFPRFSVYGISEKSALGLQKGAPHLPAAVLNMWKTGCENEIDLSKYLYKGPGQCHEQHPQGMWQSLFFKKWNTHVLFFPVY